jgi:hypothetical protein
MVESIPSEATDPKGRDADAVDDTELKGFEVPLVVCIPAFPKGPTDGAVAVLLLTVPKGPTEAAGAVLLTVPNGPIEGGEDPELLFKVPKGPTEGRAVALLIVPNGPAVVETGPLPKGEDDIVGGAAV